MTDATPELDAETLLRETARLRRLAQILVRDAATADDVAQEAWLAAVRGGAGPARGSWLTGVVRHLAMRHLRDDARSPMIRSTTKAARAM